MLQNQELISRGKLQDLLDNGTLEYLYKAGFLSHKLINYMNYKKYYVHYREIGLSHSLAVNKISHEFAVSDRTVLRGLASMREIGYLD